MPSVTLSLALHASGSPASLTAAVILQEPDPWDSALLAGRRRRLPALSVSPTAAAGDATISDCTDVVMAAAMALAAVPLLFLHAHVLKTLYKVLLSCDSTRSSNCQPRRRLFVGDSNDVTLT
jgi:hypothetical protein